jgi:glycosyltransferase involved in cell wall biosynthesis
MEVGRKKVCYLSFDGMTDPLGQSQVIPYLIKLSKHGFDFHIISVEKADMMLEKGERISSLFAENGIKWTTIEYSNKIPFVSTALTLKKAYKIAVHIFSKSEFELIHFRGYTFGNTVRKLKKKFKIPVIFDMRSFLPDERVLGGMWKLNNPLHFCIYKYFKFLEGKFYKEFDRVISQTHLGEKVIRDWGFNEEVTKVEVVPCCADLDFFNYNNYSSEDELIRKELSVTNEDFVLGYVGSIGTWYCLDDMMAFFKVLLEKKPNAKFVFLSPVAPEIIFDSAEKLGVELSSIRLKFLDRSQMPRYISIFDWSIFFIKPGIGKAASCPVKHGELMGMGIPIIANTKVGDIDLIVGEEGSGLIVESFNHVSYQNILKKLASFSASKNKIRTIGSKYYNLESGVSSYVKIYNELLN